jgi:hypothetical protein
MSIYCICKKKTPRGARWQTNTERKPWDKKPYTCYYCEKKTKQPYKWVDGEKSCHSCNESYGN